MWDTNTNGKNSYSTDQRKSKHKPWFVRGADADRVLVARGSVVIYLQPPAS